MSYLDSSQGFEHEKFEADVHDRISVISEYISFVEYCCTMKRKQMSCTLLPVDMPH